MWKEIKVRTGKSLFLYLFSHATQSSTRPGTPAPCRYFFPSISTKLRIPSICPGSRTVAKSRVHGRAEREWASSWRTRVPTSKRAQHSTRTTTWVVIDGYQPINGQCCSRTHVKRPCALDAHCVCSFWTKQETVKHYANQKILCRIIQILCSLCSFNADFM